MNVRRVELSREVLRSRLGIAPGVPFTLGLPVGGWSGDNDVALVLYVEDEPEGKTPETETP